MRLHTDYDPATDTALQDALHPDGTPSTDPTPIVLPVPMTLRQLVFNNPDRAPVVVEGLMRRREIANVVSASKAGKSWFVYSLVMSVLSGRKWLDHFQCNAGDVLLIDNELQKGTLSFRLRKVAESMGIPFDDVADRLTILPTRENCADIYKLAPMFMGVEPGRYRLIVLDALYRFYPDGYDENSNADATALYNQLNRYAHHADAPIVCVAHASKGSQSDKRVTDVMSGAGAASRAADDHIILREHQEDDCFILEAKVRDFPPPPPLGLRWTFPRFRHDPMLDVTALKGTKVKKRPDDDADAGSVNNKPVAWTVEMFVDRFVTDEPLDQKLIHARAGMAGISQRRITDLISVAVSQRILHRWHAPAKAVLYATREQTVGECVEASAKAHFIPALPKENSQNGVKKHATP